MAKKVEHTISAFLVFSAIVILDHRIGHGGITHAFLSASSKLAFVVFRFEQIITKHALVIIGLVIGISAGLEFWKWLQRIELSERCQADYEGKDGGDSKSGSYDNRYRYEAHPRPVLWWEILGVAESATVAQIKTAYRKIAKTYHPDSAQKGQTDIDRFLKATEAYDLALKMRRKF